MPSWIKAKRFSAFTALPYGGNPAWVVLGSEELTDEDLLTLASDLNPVYDTAFVFPEATAEADICLRFFNGKNEVNFSSHAAIATYFALSGENMVQLKEPETVIKQRTKTGINSVELRVDGDKVTRATITLAKPTHLDLEINPTLVARFLGLSLDDVTAAGLPMEVMSTGFYDLVVPLRSLKDLRNINPNFTLMDSFCVRLGISGVVVFCRQTFDLDSSAFMRHFAPTVGVNENPISGLAAGTLGCYLIKHKLIEAANFSRIIIEQGHLQQKQGKVYVHIETTRGQIYRVKIGGNAVQTFTGYIITP
ncbi:MAG: PhzF family phenazine biosynthesis protein [candidate division WOR-3 bacterium]|nr:MAG: PhzF family phenazine biosynthesis protein [candidate division WOR-3 bacterium]